MIDSFFVEKVEKLQKKVIFIDILLLHDRMMFVLFRDKVQNIIKNWMCYL